mgnify:CR=1 FL=1
MKTVKRIKSKIGVEIKAGFWYTVGNFFLKGVSFITIPIFTRLLSTSDYGLVSLYMTWVSFFSIVVGLSLNSSVMRGYNDHKDDYDKYLSSTLFLSLLSFAVIVLLSTLFMNQLVTLTGFPFSIVLLILGQSYLMFVINFNNMKYISQYMYKKYLLISIGNTLSGVFLSFFLIMVFQDDKYLGKIYGTFIPVFIIGTILFVSIYKKGKNLINFKYWKYALVLSLPMIPHLVAHLILGQSDRIFIDKFVGSDYVGIYSFAYNIGLISHILLSSLNNAWVPWFYKKMDEKNYNKIVDKSRYYILLLISFIIGLIYVSPEIVKIMAPIEYSEAIWIIPVIVMSYFFQFLYTILVNIQFYYKKNFFIPLGTVIAGLVNIGLNIYYIPLYGYAAAAYTTLASYVILFLLHYIITRYFIKSDIYTFVFFIKPILLVIILTSIFFFLTEEILIRYVMLLFVFTIVLIKYRLKIIKFIK